MDLSRKQRSPSNNSVFDLLQMELENLKHGRYCKKKSKFENKYLCVDYFLKDRSFLRKPIFLKNVEGFVEQI